MLRHFAPVIGLCGGLVPALAQAQTNIDQGKSPAEIFASDCATCHKTPRGLASGQNSLTLTGFLVEHYTASRDQASALAAYVMGAGGGASPPASRNPKGAPERATTATGENAKPDERGAAAARRLPSREDAKKLGEAPPAAQEPGRRPAAPGHAVQPAVATREHPKEPESKPGAEEPAAVAAEPAASPASPVQEIAPTAAAAPSVAAPASAEPSDSAPVPRDDIPD